MISRLAGMIGTDDLSEWESGFIANIVEITDNNTAVAIVGVVRRFWIVAAMIHRVPNAVFWSAREAASRHLQATTRRGVAITKGRPANGGSFAAFVFRATKQFGRITRSHLDLLIRFTVVRAARKLHTSGRLALLCQNAA